ncbi:hypothetical protein SDC9_169948 [bioreactor metagenome]|uniref:Uncharacterized protein n=1 Tax=bioreactor metagenome TaxID=1076179 RepID=A0A645G7F2_9ZZZZ
MSLAPLFHVLHNYFKFLGGFMRQFGDNAAAQPGDSACLYCDRQARLLEHVLGHHDRLIDTAEILNLAKEYVMELDLVVLSAGTALIRDFSQSVHVSGGLDLGRAAVVTDVAGLAHPDRFALEDDVPLIHLDELDHLAGAEIHNLQATASARAAATLHAGIEVDAGHALDFPLQRGLGF